MQLIEQKVTASTQVIMPMGDIQYGAQDVNISALKRYVEIARQEHAWVIGLGDYTDLLSPSNRKRLAASELYDSPMEVLDEVMYSHVDELYKLLRPLKGRVLGLCHGHHYYRTLSGKTTDELLADKLDAPYIGSAAVITLRFPAGPYRIFATHGQGGGVSAAGHIGKLERLANGLDVDAVIMGHCSKLAAAKIQRIQFDNGSLHSRDLILASSGAYFEGYKADRRMGGEPTGSYVEQKMLPPVALGSAILRVRPQMRDGTWHPRATVEI